MPDQGSTVPASMAGYIAQLRRALFRLASAGGEDKVGVETLDDVATVKKALIELEQDKLTLSADASPITNRDPALWKTLDIWTDAWITYAQTDISLSFSLVTNRECSGSIVKQLTIESRSEIENIAIVRALEAERSVVQPQPSEKLQQLINRVVDRGTAILAAVIRNVHLAPQFGAFGDQLIQDTVDRLHLSDRINPRTIYQQLFGWMVDYLMEAWQADRPGWIDGKVFNRAMEAITIGAHRTRVLARAARVIDVSPEDVASSRTHRFVHHLALIEMDDVRVDRELIRYLQFGSEKLRLLEEGAVLRRHFDERGDRLEERWQQIRERHSLFREGHPATKIGWKIYLDAAEHREPLAGEPMEEVYMTIGHFHRLADDDRVYWHPDYRPEQHEGSNVD